MTGPNSRAGDHRIQAYIDFVFKWRWLVLLATLGAAALAASGARHIAFNNDYQYFFRDDNPQLRAFEDLQEIYTKNDNTLFVVAPESGEVFTPETLAAVGEITERGWQLPHATRADSITNFQYSHAVDDDLIVGDLVDLEREYTADELAELRAIALAEPLLKRRLIPDDARVTAIFVRHTLPRKSSDEATKVALAARELAADIESKYPGHSVYLTGSVMLTHAFFEASVQDLSTLVPIMYVILLITAVLFLRSFWGMLITLVVIALSTSTAMGMAGWLGIPITSPSASAPTMIMTLAVADTIHLLVTFFQSRHKGTTKKEAMTESLRINLNPVFLTSFTTIIGLLALNLSDVRPFNDLGNIAAMGVTAAFVYTLLVLPPLVAILPLGVGRKPAGKGGPAPIVKLGDFVIAKQRGLLWLGAGLLALLSVMVIRNELNDEFVEYFDESFAFRADTDFVSENLSGMYTMEFSLDSGEEGGISNPAFIATIDAFAQWLRAQPNVHHVFTLSDTFKRLNKNMHGDDPEWYVLPEERELAAQYLLLYEMSLPFGLDLNDTINIDKSSTRLAATLDNVSAVRQRELQSQTEAWLRQNAPETMWTVPASRNLMFAHISERNIKSSLLSTFLALVLISLTLAVAFRSVKFGALSLLPNLAPLVASFGIWGIIVGQVNVGNAVVGTMALGIIVDDTVHFLSKYLRAEREFGLSAEQAVRYSFATVGAALVATSVILVAGFLVLALSPFGINAGIGLLAAIIMVVALIGELVFLPPLLLAIDERAMTARLSRIPPEARGAPPPSVSVE
jgi:hypothetical protein